MSFITAKVLALFVTLIVAALALLALPVPRVVAQAGGEGKVEGQIVNGTKDAKPSSTSNLTITLLSIAQGATSMISSTAQTDANGRFAFPNLSTVTTTQYLVATSYGGIPYYSDVFAFDANLTTVPISMTVYETTGDPSVVRVAQTHLIVDVQTRLLNVTEVVAAENTSDRVLVGTTSASPHAPTLLIPILPNATDVQFSNPPDADGTTLQGNGVLTYTQRFYPGDNSSNTIVMHYSVPFNPPTYDLALKMTYDTPTLNVLLADIGETVQASQLSAPAPYQAPNGARFIQTSGGNLKAGSTVSMTINNLPATVAAPAAPGTAGAPTAAPANNNLQLVGGIVLGVAALAAVGLLLYPVLRRRREQVETETVDSTAEERMELLQAMADLDDEFEAGKISEADYKQERARLKQELLDLTSRGEE